MNASLKATKKKVDRLIASHQYVRDENNRIIVNMNINDDSDFLSVFSENETPVISSKVAEFIETSTNHIPTNEPLTLRVHSNCIDGKEKGNYSKAIKHYYTSKYIENEREIKRSNLVAIILTLAGILLLPLSIILEGNISGKMWAEVLNIYYCMVLFVGSRSNYLL